MIKSFFHLIVVSSALFCLAIFSAHKTYAFEGEQLDEGKLAIKMAPFNFQLLERGRQKGKVVIDLTLVVQEQQDSELIRERLPQIRSDFLGALTSLSKQRFKANRAIDPDLVTAYLTPFLVNRIGEGKAGIFVQYALITPS